MFFYRSLFDAEKIFLAALFNGCVCSFMKNRMHIQVITKANKKALGFLILFFDIQSLPFLVIRIVFDLILIDIGLFV